MSKIDTLIAGLPAELQDRAREALVGGINDNFDTAERIAEQLITSGVEDVSRLPTAELVALAKQVNALLKQNIQALADDRDQARRILVEAAMLGVACARAAALKL